jgi:beta-lactamase class A
MAFLSKLLLMKNQVKDKPKLAKAKKHKGNLFAKLKKHSRLIIIVTSLLASTGWLLGVFFLSNKSPSALETKNNIKEVEIASSASPASSASSTVQTTINFPPSQLPPSFNLPVPKLISGKTELGNIVHRSTLSKTPLKASDRLQKIVDGVVQEVTNDQLKKEDLSISIIDVTRGEIAGYQPNKMKYPASIVKLFWVVALYEQIDQKLWKNPETFDKLAKKMIVESDNEAASFIVDSISGAPSISKDLSDKDWQAWHSKRLFINQFFSKGGYEDLNVSQKTYPIPYLKLNEPLGTDQRVRLEATTPEKPKSNQVSAEQAANLMYETCYVPALSVESAKKICSWLGRDLKDTAWQKAPGVPINDFNPIRGFMGEGVAKNPGVTIRSKAGWTKGSRQEVVAIKSSNGNVFIVSVFANSPAYATNAQVFPNISSRLYTELARG